MTETVQDEQSAREGDLFRLLVGNITDYAIIVLDGSGFIQEWPQGAQQVFGYQPEDVLGSSVGILFTDEDVHRGEPELEIEQARVTGRGEDDRWLLRKDGTRFWGSGLMMPLWDDLDRLRGFVKIIRDKTAEKLQAEQERLRVSSDLCQQKQAVSLLAGQRQILEMIATDAPLAEVLTAVSRLVEEHEPGSVCAILLVDRETRRMRRGVGPGLPKAFLDALEGRPLVPPIGPCAATLDSGQTVVVRNAQADTRWSPEWGNVLATGDLHFCQTTPIFASDDSVLAALAIYRHQSDPEEQLDESFLQIASRLATIAIERSHVMAELQQNQAGFETLVNSSPVGTFLIDAEMRIRLLNPKMQAAIENVDRAIGKDFVRIMYSLWDETVARDIVQRFRHTLETGQPYHNPEFIEERRDLNQSVYYDWQIHRVLLPDGQYGVVCYFADISHHVLARRSIAEADRRKTEFLATLGHELRNPLTPIKAAVQLMQMNRDDPREHRELAEVIDRQVVQMTCLIDDLLDVSRISCGKIALRVGPCNIGVVLYNALEATKPFLAESQQTLHLQQSDESLTVNGDCHRLVQVVINLLNNAAKYTPAQGHIWLSAVREDEHAVIEVRDNGIGLAADRLEKVFEIFEQVDSASDRSQRGLGIGLSLVKSLVELHQGDVTAHSDGPGKGSTFRIRLPLISPPQHSRPTFRGGRSKPPKTEPARSLRVLVVEDTEVIRFMMVRLLHRMGHQVAEAADGSAGLQTALSFQPDVIFSDISMPVMTGHELAKRARNTASLRHIPLIALTGFGQEADRQQALDAGFDDHLVKPVDAADLARILQTVGAP